MATPHTHTILYTRLLAGVLQVRGQAIALATITNFASNFAVSLALPTIQEEVGQAGEALGCVGGRAGWAGGRWAGAAHNSGGGGAGR